MTNVILMMDVRMICIHIIVSARRADPVTKEFVDFSNRGYLRNRLKTAISSDSILFAG
jgi:hypothetical protein